MSPSWVDSEEGTSTDRRGSEEDKNVNIDAQSSRRTRDSRME